MGLDISNFAKQQIDPAQEESPGALSDSVVNASSGTLAARPSANTVSAGWLYFATDDNGGTIYESDGTTWTQWTPGVLAAPKGLLGSTKVTTSLNAALAAAWQDAAGFSVPFTYNGRPIIVDLQMTWLKYSAATANMQFKIVDVASAKDVYIDQVITPEAGIFFAAKARTNPLQTMADGTALVVGQAYTFKVQVNPINTGTLTSAYVTNSGYYGHLSVVEA